MALQYYTKFFVYFSSFIIIPSLNIPLFLLRPRNSSNLLILSRCFKPVTALLGLKYVIKGQENLVKNKSFIVVANHQSIIDMLGIYQCVPMFKKCTVITNRYLLWTGPFGVASWLAGHVFVKQNYSNQTKTQFEEVLKKLKQNNEVLWVCPEGGVQNNGQIRQFKKGAFHLAIKSQLPIVPLVFSPFVFFDRNKKKFDSATIIVQFLPPIDTANLSSDNVNNLTEKVRNIMSKTFDELKQ